MSTAVRLQRVTALQWESSELLSIEQIPPVTPRSEFVAVTRPVPGHDTDRIHISDLMNQIYMLTDEAPI